MLDLAPDTRLDAHERESAEHLACHCNSAWCVAHTHPQAERWATLNLQRQGYVAYLPLRVVARRDRVTPAIRHHVEVPLFAGYLFVQHQRGTSWRPIYETPGVHSLIKNGSQLQYAPEAAVSALQAGDASRRAIDAGKSLWAPGTPCSARYGALCGYPAAVVSVRGEQAVIAVMLFGALREVRVPVASLEARAE